MVFQYIKSLDQKFGFRSLTITSKIEGGVQQCRNTTVPKKAGNFQNNLHAFSKERENTDANYQREPLQFWRQNVCNSKLNIILAPNRLNCKFSLTKSLSVT